jgi:hypothetical protein
MKMSNFIDLYIPDNKFSLFQNFLLNRLINFTKSAEFDTKPENLTTKSRNIKHFIFLTCNQIFITLYLQCLSKRNTPNQTSFKMVNDMVKLNFIKLPRFCRKSSTGIRNIATNPDCRLIRGSKRYIFELKKSEYKYFYKILNQ